MVVVDKENYEAEVEQYQGAAIVDLWGPQCEPCKALMPYVEELSKQYEGKVKFCKLNSAENRRLAMRLRVMGLPTILFYKNGEVVDKLSGAADVTIDAIKARIDEKLL